jgi:hypothetical protein
LSNKETTKMNDHGKVSGRNNKITVEGERKGKKPME